MHPANISHNHTHSVTKRFSSASGRRVKKTIRLRDLPPFLRDKPQGYPNAAAVIPSVGSRRSSGQAM